MDIVTKMIVDIVGVWGHQLGEAQSWQKITVKELRLHLQPMQMFHNNHSQRKGWLCILVVCNVSYLYISIQFIS